MSMFNNGANDRWEIGDAIELDLDELLGRGPDDDDEADDDAAAGGDEADTDEDDPAGDDEWPHTEPDGE